MARPKKDAISSKIEKAKPKKATISKKATSKNEPTKQVNVNRKVVVITGVTSGMGKEVTKRLMEKGGYTILGACRSPFKCVDAIMSWKAKYKESDLHLLIADLSIMKQVRALADNIKNKLKTFGYDKIDVLYLNAGQMMQEVQMTYENNEVQWATNYLANALLMQLLLPLVRKSSDGRIILTTNDKAMKTKLNWDIINNPKRNSATSIYNQSKLAELMFALEFDNRHLDEENVKTFVVNPGRVCTDLGIKNTTGFKRWLCNLRNLSACSVEEGIATVMYLIEAPALPSRVVYYKNSRPEMPSNYALDLDNREELYKATLRLLDLPLDKVKTVEE